MKPKSLLLFLLLLPALACCQTISMPAVSSSGDPTTIISKVEVNQTNTIVTFRHTCSKGSWVQLNKSMYLQDAKGEQRYNYIRSEGIPLRPERFTATTDNQILEFKVYFEKLKAGTKAINVIERALSVNEQQSSVSFFNYYNVSLEKSANELEHHVLVDHVLINAPENTLPPTDGMSSITPMITSMYTGMLNAQLKLYSDPAVVNKLADINKKYYDALIKAGFSDDQALKILTSKSLVSTEIGGKQ